MAGRELVAWVPDEPADPSLFALEDAGGSSGWDQFAVNKVRAAVIGGGPMSGLLRMISGKRCAQWPAARQHEAVAAAAALDAERRNRGALLLRRQ